MTGTGDRSGVENPDASRWTELASLLAPGLSGPRQVADPLRLSILAGNRAVLPRRLQFTCKMAKLSRGWGQSHFGVVAAKNP